MAPEQVKFEAFVRDHSLRELEDGLVDLGITFYSLVPAKVYSRQMSLSAEIRRDPKDAYFHDRHKLEVVVDEAKAQPVRDLLESIVDGDTIATMPELVKAYIVYPAEQLEPSFVR